MNKPWKLKDYNCNDGECLMLVNVETDSKIGALSLDHRSVGEGIVEELNHLEFMRKSLLNGVSRCRQSNRLLHRDFDKLWDFCKDNGWTEEELIMELER